MSMYHGKNPTALQSQRWLAKSLVALMEERPYAQITIKDICDRADLSRQTFYNFFASKEEVLRFCLRQKYEAQFAKYSQQTSLSLPEILTAFTTVLTENKKLLTILLQNGLDGILSDEIFQCVALFAGRFVSPEKDNVLLPYSEALLSGALAHLLVYWVRQDAPISTEELTGLLTDFFRGRLYELEGLQNG